MCLAFLLGLFVLTLSLSSINRLKKKKTTRLAEANVGLVFNELLAGVGSWTNTDDDGGGDDDDGNNSNSVMSRSAIPLGRATARS